MDAELEKQIISILEGAQDMTVATVREDGYPQATTVSFVNDGLLVYFGCTKDSQKARNIARNDKVSLAANLLYSSWDKIRGVSIGGTAARVSDPNEIERMGKLMVAKFPQILRYVSSGLEGVAIFRITPKVISVLDYSKGFGHTELVHI
jgi:general stress protein 26